MTIHVTQAHIDAGKRGYCTRCPIALALQAATGVIWRVTICRIIGPNTNLLRREIIETPESVAAFISRFDVEWTVQPFSFEVDIPVEAPRA